jgi:hypothetical protein
MIFKVYPGVGSIEQRLRTPAVRLTPSGLGVPHKSQRNGPSSSLGPLCLNIIVTVPTGTDIQHPSLNTTSINRSPRFAATFGNHITLKIQQFGRRLTLPARSAVRGAGPNPGSGKRYDRHSARPVCRDPIEKLLLRRAPRGRAPELGGLAASC